MPNPLSEAFQAAARVSGIKWTHGDVPFRFMPTVNMNAKQRRKVRRFEKKIFPQMAKRYLQMVEDAAAKRLAAVAGLGGAE